MKVDYYLRVNRKLLAGLKGCTATRGMKNTPP